MTNTSGGVSVNDALANGSNVFQGLQVGQGLRFAAPAGGFEGPAGPATAILEGPAEVGEVGIAVPGLFLLDLSWSMQAALASIEVSIGELAKGLRQNAAASPNAYLAISSFADDARNELPLTRIADPAVTIPTLNPRGNGTNYNAAFSEALARFRTDLPLLATTPTGGKRQIFRPTIYFVSDGQPNTGGDWRGPLAELKSRSWKPNIMAFGFGGADRDVIREIASEGMAYFADDGQTPDVVLGQILKVILRSMISATVTANGQAAGPTAPTTTPAINPQTDPATNGLHLIDPINTSNIN